MDLTTVTGTLYRPDGRPAQGVSLRLHSFIKDDNVSALINQDTAPSDAGGAISFTAPRDCWLFISGLIRGLNGQPDNGIIVRVPDAGSATLTTLLDSLNEIPPGLFPILEPQFSFTLADGVVLGDTYSSLDEAIDDIGAAVKTLIVNGALAASDDLIVPATLQLGWVNDGYITVASGKDVLIESGAAGWPLRRLFSGSGSVHFGSRIAEAYPHWFNAAFDGVTDDQPAIQKCLDAFNPSTLSLYAGVARAGRVWITGAAAVNDTIIQRYSSLTLQGPGWGSSASSPPGACIKALDGCEGKPIILIRECWGSGVRNLRVIGNAAHKPSAGIEIRNIDDSNEGLAGRKHATDLSFLQNVYVGYFFGYDSDTSPQLESGVLFSGETDNDSNYLEQVQIAGADIGLDIPNHNSSFTQGNNIFIGACTLGIKSSPSVNFTNVTMGNNGRDIGYYTPGNATIQITNFGSEGSGRLSAVDGQQGCRLAIIGGSFQCGDNFTPADTGNDRFLMDHAEVGGGTAHLERFDVLLSGSLHKNPVIRIGNSMASSGPLLRLIDVTGIGPSNIRMEPVPVADPNECALIELLQTNGGLLPPYYSRVYTDSRRTEDRDFQLLRTDWPGKVNVFGGPLKVKRIPTPTGVTATPTGSGATNYSYKVVAHTYDGQTTDASSAATCVNAATLDSTHYNTIFCAQLLGASAYSLYGRTSGSEQLIVTKTAAEVVQTGGVYLVDDGSLTPSGALPTVNGTGRVYLGSPNLAPTDSEIDNGQWTAYLDVSANKWKIRARYPDGTLHTGEMILT